MFKINEKYAIDTDPLQFTLMELKPTKKEKKDADGNKVIGPDGKVVKEEVLEWKPEGYYGNLKSLAYGLLKRDTKDALMTVTGLLEIEDRAKFMAEHLGNTFEKKFRSMEKENQRLEALLKKNGIEPHPEEGEG